MTRLACFYVPMFVLAARLRSEPDLLNEAVVTAARTALDAPPPPGTAIETQPLQTQVRVENGCTVVIGGIFTLEETNNETKVPLLGDVPYLGNLFKSRERTSRKQEMLVFITPKMITDRAAAR